MIFFLFFQSFISLVTFLVTFILIGVGLLNVIRIRKYRNDGQKAAANLLTITENPNSQFPFSIDGEFLAVCDSKQYKIRLDFLRIAPKYFDHILINKLSTVEISYIVVKRKHDPNNRSSGGIIATFMLSLQVEDKSFYNTFYGLTVFGFLFQITFLVCIIVALDNKSNNENSSLSDQIYGLIGFGIYVFILIVSFMVYKIFFATNVLQNGGCDICRCLANGKGKSEVIRKVASQPDIQRITQHSAEPERQIMRKYPENRGSGLHGSGLNCGGCCVGCLCACACTGCSLVC